jgi:hypothetical protein
MKGESTFSGTAMENIRVSVGGNNTVRGGAQFLLDNFSLDEKSTSLP